MGFITIKNLHHSLGGSRDDDFPLRTRHRGTGVDVQATSFVGLPRGWLVKKNLPKMTLLVLDDDNWPTLCANFRSACFNYVLSVLYPWTLWHMFFHFDSNTFKYQLAFCVEHFLYFAFRLFSFSTSDLRHALLLCNPLREHRCFESNDYTNLYKLGP